MLEVDHADTAEGAVALPVPGDQRQDGSVPVGLLCAVSLSAPFWAALVGAARVLLG